MKIRSWFVSNSSSSSFIIHKSAFKNDDEMREFIDELNNLVAKFENDDEYSGGWSESGRTFSTEENFIIVEDYYCPDEVTDLINKFKLRTNKNTMSFDY